MTVISYPIPAYSNVPIHAEYYQPRRFVISAITRGFVTTITTTLNTDYVIGQLVRLIIPAVNGAIQLNGQQGYVIAIPSPNQVVLDISSKLANNFVAAVGPVQPQILALGDVNSGAINSSGRRNNGTYIPGSFINISPQ